MFLIVGSKNLFHLFSPSFHPGSPVNLRVDEKAGQTHRGLGGPGHPVRVVEGNVVEPRRLPQQVRAHQRQRLQRGGCLGQHFSGED